MTMERIKPDDYYSADPPSRIMGSECEYRVQAPDYKGKQESIKLTEKVVSEAFGPSSKMPHNWTVNSVHNSFWFSNGAKLYQDVGEYIEYCSPESLGPKEAASSDLAGIFFMAQLARSINKAKAYRRTGLFLPDGNDKEHYTSSGYHENYLVPKSTVVNKRVGRLPSFLATRVWSFSGMLASQYLLSQKALGCGGQEITDSMERRTSKSQKPLILLRGSLIDDNDVNGNDWGRVEVRYADAGQSKWAKFMGFAATSLVLRMEEHNMLGFKRIDKAQFKRPIDAVHEIAKDKSLSEVYETVNGGKMSAIDVQESYALDALKLSESIKLPEDELLAIDEWLKICDDLRIFASTGDISLIADSIDWAAHYAILSAKYGEDKLSASNRSALGADLVWDRIEPPGIAQKWWHKAGGRQQILDDQEINSLVYNPPLHTRANIRGRCIKEGEITCANWMYIQYGDRTIDLTNPYINVDNKQSRAA